MKTEELKRYEAYPDIIVGVREAARVLRVTPGRVDQLIHEGKLQAYDVGVGKQRGRWIFHRKDLETVLELEQNLRGRNFQGGLHEQYVSPLEAARLLQVDYDEVMSMVERGELQAPFVQKQKNRTNVRILSSSVQEILEQRRSITARDLLNAPLLEIWQVAEVLGVDELAVRDLAKEGKLRMLNITPKGKYELWRILTSSLKQYQQVQEELKNTYFATLEEAGEALGVTGERVRQLIGEGKLEAKDMRNPGDLKARWFVNRSSVQCLRAQSQEDL